VEQMPAASQGPRAEGTSPAEGQRAEQPERVEGERGGRRSRRGGRRRRRDGGEQFGGEPRNEGRPAEAAAPVASAVGSDLPPGSRSFDFSRPAEGAAERPPVEATTPPVVRPPHEAQEWTPAPPSDATREGPRSEP
jgi:ribonuclease E